MGAALVLLVAAARAQDERAGPDDHPTVLGRPTRLVAKVEGHPITATDVWRMMDLALPQETEATLRQIMLGELGRLVARDEGIDVPRALLDEAVETALTEQRARFEAEVASDVTLEEYLAARHGLSLEQHVEEMRRMVLTSLLLERAVRLDQRRMRRDETAVILVEDAVLAREIADQLVDGASFSVLARRHSVHPSGAFGGGLPPVPPDARIDLLEGREALEAGDVLGPAPIDIGEARYYRLVRLVGRVEPDERPWDALREEIEAEIVTRPVIPAELSIFEERVRGRYRVEQLGPGPDEP